VATYERIDSELAKLGDPSSPPDPFVRSEMVQALAQAVRDYARVDPAGAMHRLPAIQEHVDDALKPPSFAWFKAQRRLVEARVAVTDLEVARRRAEAMIAPLTAMDFLDAACFADTLRALQVTGGLTDDAAARLIVLVESRHIDEKTERLAIAVHFARESVDGPAKLAGAAAALIMRSVPSSDLWFADWYKRAFEVLTSLLAGGQSRPARWVAETLLQQVIRSDILWVDRATILGGLVKSNEPTVRDEALRRLTIEDAFIDHVTDLPDDLLRALLASPSFTGLLHE
jgi:hypothetical protein